MSAAYFIVVDHADPGFDPFVNGKAFAAEVATLERIARSKGWKTPDDFVSMSLDDMGDIDDDFGIDSEEVPDERWFNADEGIQWCTQLRGHLEANPTSVKKPAEVIADLREMEAVLKKVKSLGARWHLSVDF